MCVGSFNYFLNFGESQEKCLIYLDSSLWGRSWESVHFGVFLNSSKSCSSLHVSGLLQLGFMKKKNDKAFLACSVEERKRFMRTQMGICGI